MSPSAATRDDAHMAEADAKQQIDRRLEEVRVREHLALVHYAVAEMGARVPRHVSRADLVSAGMVGLAQAARSFDDSRGIAFDRYASTRIRGALLDELRSRDWASRSVRAKARKVGTATDELTTSLGRSPTCHEVAERVGMEAAAITSLADDVHRAVVLNYDSIIASGEGEAAMPSESCTPEAVLLDRERKAYLIDAVAALPERLRRVVVGYFFEERPMQALADELGVSESRISQMRAEALTLLKEGMNSQLEPEEPTAERRCGSRVARRKAAYFTAVADGSDFRSRLDAVPASRQRLLDSSGVAGLGARQVS
jgi:RNA polymerase sigma factor for flagellar operon FliA